MRTIRPFMIVLLFSLLLFGVHLASMREADLCPAVIDEDVTVASACQDRAQPGVLRQPRGHCRTAAGRGRTDV
jgi:hypothetical protein